MAIQKCEYAVNEDMFESPNENVVSLALYTEPLVAWSIGVNEVTGRQFARFKLIKKPLPRKTKRKMERAAACSMPLRQNKINLRI